MDNLGTDAAASAATARGDLDAQVRAALQAHLERLEMTPRSEFNLQSRTLERTRARLEQLEQRVATVEKRLLELEEGIPPPAE